MTPNADYGGTAARWQEFARKLMDDLCPICGERFGENPREHVACLLLSPSQVGATTPNADYVGTLSEEFPGLLREALRARKITQAEFAKRIERTEKHVSQVLNGNAGTSLNEWDAWALALGLRFKIQMVALPPNSRLEP